MATLQEIANKFGFILSDVFARHSEITSLSGRDLLGNASSIEEIVLKISRTFKIRNTPRSSWEIRRALYGVLKEETAELSGTIFAQYFIDGHRIHTLFATLQVFEDGDQETIESFWATEKDTVGYFDQLKCVEFCRSIADVRTFVLSGTGLERFFEGVRVENRRYQDAYPVVLRNYYNEYHGRCHSSDSGYTSDYASEYFQAIVVEEAKMFLLDVWLGMGTEQFKKRLREYIPDFKGPDGFSIEQALEKLIGLKSAGEAKEVFELEGVDIYEGLRAKRIRLYNGAFEIFNELSAIYAFLQLREFQIRDVLFVIDRVLNKSV